MAGLRVVLDAGSLGHLGPQAGAGLGPGLTCVRLAAGSPPAGSGRFRGRTTSVQSSSPSPSSASTSMTSEAAAAVGVEVGLLGPAGLAGRL